MCITFKSLRSYQNLYGSQGLNDMFTFVINIAFHFKYCQEHIITKTCEKNYILTFCFENLIEEQKLCSVPLLQGTRMFRKCMSVASPHARSINTLVPHFTENTQCTQRGQIDYDGATSVARWWTDNSSRFFPKISRETGQR